MPMALDDLFVEHYVRRLVHLKRLRNDTYTEDPRQKLISRSMFSTYLSLCDLGAKDRAEQIWKPGNTPEVFGKKEDAPEW